LGVDIPLLLCRPYLRAFVNSCYQNVIKKVDQKTLEVDKPQTSNLITNPIQKTVEVIKPCIWYNGYMSPRGFYTRESLHPHFTTKAYRESDQYKSEIEAIHTIEVWFKGLLSLPRKIATKVWIWTVAFYLGKTGNHK
jgi:hypothetical protein